MFTVQHITRSLMPHLFLVEKNSMTRAELSLQEQLELLGHF